MDTYCHLYGTLLPVRSQRIDAQDVTPAMLREAIAQYAAALLALSDEALLAKLTAPFGSTLETDTQPDPQGENAHA